MTDRPDIPEERRIRELEAERDIWKARFDRLMGWVQWFKKVANWHPKNYRNKNRMVGVDDLFVAVLELEKEVDAEHGDREAAAYLCALAAGRDNYVQAKLMAEHEANLAAGDSASGRARGADM